MALANLSGYDMVLADDIGLTLYRDGKAPAVQGGRFSQSEAMRSGQGLDQPVIYDRFDGGLGSTERLVPYTYPLVIDGCTRFSRVWTPAGENTALGALPVGAGGRVPGEIRSMITTGNDVLIGAGGVVLRSTYPYTAFTVEATLDVTEEVQTIMEYNQILLIGTRKVADGTPGRLYAKIAGVWTRSTTANRQFLLQAYFVIAGVGAWRLIANDTPYSFKFISSTVPGDILTDTIWTSESGAGYPVADTTCPITNLVGAPTVMYFVKTNGVYHIGEDGRAQRIADWSDSVHPENGKAALFAYGRVFASHKRWGLVSVDVASLQVQWQTASCAPGGNMPRISPIHGTVTALGMDGEWIVALVNNGTDTFTCYGRPVETTQRETLTSIRANQPINWHGSEATFWAQKGTRLLQASVGPNNRPLLWVGTLSGATPLVSQVSLPDAATPLEDWISGGPHRFTTNSWLYTPREDFGDDNGAGWASVKKIFTRLDLNADYLMRDQTWLDVFMSTAGGHQIFWDRALDDASLWTMIGRFEEGERISLVPGTTVQSGMKASLLFRGYGEDQAPFAFYTAKLRGIPIMEQQERRQYRCVVGRVRKANRAQDQRTRLAVLNQMWALQWSDPVSLLDQSGAKLVVKVEEGMSYQEMNDPATQQTVTMVTFTVRILRRPFYWGTAFRWGSDITWS